MSKLFLRIVRLVGPTVILIAGALRPLLGQYSVLRPVPDSLVRPLATDRPGAGENPFTLDAGRFQFELNGFGFTRFGAAAPGFAMTDAGAAKLRVGLGSHVEAQALFNGYVWIHPPLGEGERITAGFGARLKVNLLGNDGEGFAVGVIPSVIGDRANDGHDAVRWSFSAAAAQHLPADIVVGGTLSASVISAWPSGFASIGVSRPVAGPVAMLLEWTAIRADLREAATEERFGSALMITLSPSSQFDAGIDLGVTRGATAFRTYVGAVRRF